MKKLKVLMFLFCATSFFHLFSQEEFLTSISSGYFYNEAKIDFFVDEVMVGTCSYAKIPCFSKYVIYDFYVYPEQRSKGYGQKLLLHVCDVLKEMKARTIYIQPGPFEVKEGYIIAIADKQIHQTALERLVKMYKKAGFISVNWFLSKCASFMYKIAGIDEDAQYLLVKTI